MCTMVCIPLPPFVSNYRTTSHSESVKDRRCILPLFPVVGWSDTYLIPPSSFALSNVKIYRAELTMTVDFIEPDRRPLIFTSHRTPACPYLSRIFIRWTHYKSSIFISLLYTIGLCGNSSLTRPLPYLYTIIFNQSFQTTIISSLPWSLRASAR